MDGVVHPGIVHVGWLSMSCFFIFCGAVRTDRPSSYVPSRFLMGIWMYASHSSCSTNAFEWVLMSGEGYARHFLRKSCVVVSGLRSLISTTISTLVEGFAVKLNSDGKLLSSEVFVTAAQCEVRYPLATQPSASARCCAGV